MIRSPWMLAAVLAALVVGLKALARRPRCAWMFAWLPVPFWCYMVPMLMTTAGVFPSTSPAYEFLARWALPTCLVWLLTGVDVRAVMGMGRTMAVMMTAGFIGIVGGAVLAAWGLQRWLPPESWKALGALAATWTGGSANMLAVKEALGAPESVFAPIVMTDGVFAYGWMSLLVLAAGRQERFDAWIGADAPAAPLVPDRHGRNISAPAAAVAGMIAAAGAVWVAPRFPSFGGALSPSGWAVLIATTAALTAATILSRRRWGVSGDVEKAGNFLLLMLVASLGARASVGAAARSPIFLAAGAVVLTVHAAVLLAAVRMTRTPLALAATASQCCVGGVVSGPLVAAVYRPALAAGALLMAVAANAVGTYVGLLTAAICRWVTG